MAFLEYQPQQPLYHYCSPEAFEGIIKSKTLWFSDLTQLNDPRELELGFEKFLEALKSVRHEEYEGYRGFFLSTLAGKLSSLRTSHQAFCCCFSLVGDDLPLWGAYTRYEGLSIGFKPTAIKDIQARLQKVEYLVDTTPDTFRKKVLDIAAPYDVDSGDEDQKFWIEASVAAFAAITALKHNSWIYEREVRMVHLQSKKAPDPGDAILVSPDGDTVDWNAPLKRSTVRGEVDYLRFPFGRYRDGADHHRRAIEKVVIGPNCALTPQDVASMLTSNGYTGVEVKGSDCRIR